MMSHRQYHIQDPCGSQYLPLHELHYRLACTRMSLKYTHFLKPHFVLTDCIYPHAYLHSLLLPPRPSPRRQCYTNKEPAVAGVVPWIEHRPVNQRVVGSIPSQGTCLGCGPGPHLGVCKRQPHIDVSLSLFLPPFL